MNPSLFSPEGLAGLLFLVMIALTVAGALLATNARRLIRAVAGLALCFVGVAGIYYFLNSPFVALMQILIYVGAVCITFVFAVMLAEPEEMQRVNKRNALVGPLSILVSGVMVWGLVALAAMTSWQKSPVRLNDGSLEKLGESLLGRYSMSFEMISIVLLVAIIGSLVLARAGRTK
jgi:NADH-quinone oxidoreductase subunit J